MHKSITTGNKKLMMPSACYMMGYFVWKKIKLLEGKNTQTDREGKVLDKK